MPTVADIHSRRVPRREVRRVPSGGGNGSMPDPIEEATQTRKELLGMRMMQQSADEIEADLEARKAEIEARKAEAETKTLEARTKLEQIRGGGAQAQQSGQASDMMVLIAEMIETMKGQNAGLQQQVQELQQGVFAGQVEMLKSELANLRHDIMARAVGPSDDSNVQTLAARIEEVKQAKEALDPFFGRVPELAGAGSDINTMLLMNRMQDEREKWLAQFRAEREDREFERSMAVERFRAEKARSESIASALSQIAPTIAKGAEQFMSGISVPSPSPAAASASSSTITQPCQMKECGGTVSIQPGQDIALCSTCGQQYQVQNQPG